MILLGGIRSEPSIALVAAALEASGAEFRIIHQRDVADYVIDWSLDAEGPRGMLGMAGETISLDDVSGIYLRLMDSALLPEVTGLAADDPTRLHVERFHDALFRWTEVAKARVVNRAEPQGSNISKPYQAQLIAACGFLIPPTLITNDPAAALAFREEHGAIIYKSISAVRSIVHTLEDSDLGRLERIGWCPVQFQAELKGHNIRVHVVGDEVFPTKIESTHVDYRYASRQGGSAQLSACVLPDEVAERCVALTRTLGLEFSGVDLMRTDDDAYYCFEVNPQPAFSYFEANTDQPIAAAVARRLADAPSR